MHIEANSQKLIFCFIHDWDKLISSTLGVCESDILRKTWDISEQFMLLDTIKVWKTYGQTFAWKFRCFFMLKTHRRIHEIFSLQLENSDSSASNTFSVVRNEPESADRDSSSSITKNVTIVTTVEETDHSIGTPFVIAVWILSASIAKIGKRYFFLFALFHWICFLINTRESMR